MSLFKEYPALGEGIYVRCLSLWVSTEATDPVVQIIDRKKQYVGSFSSLQEKTCEA